LVANSGRGRLRLSGVRYQINLSTHSVRKDVDNSRANAASG
jgi:hypothetical protein